MKVFTLMAIVIVVLGASVFIREDPWSSGRFRMYDENWRPKAISSETTLLQIDMMCLIKIGIDGDISKKMLTDGTSEKIRNDVHNNVQEDVQIDVQEDVQEDVG